MFLVEIVRKTPNFSRFAREKAFKCNIIVKIALILGRVDPFRERTRKKIAFLPTHTPPGGGGGQIPRDGKTQ
jgi:hypothetical protein